MRLIDELISKERLKQDMLKHIFYCGEDLDDALEVIEAQPTIDAVPVVRCKGCEYYQTDDDETFCDLFGMYNVDHNGFCAWGGKRKEE